MSETDDWTLVRKGRKRGERENEAARFWAKVKKGGPDECWIWTAGMSEGYGAIMVWRNGKWRKMAAHIWAYEDLIGPIPDGHGLHHEVCQNKACCNPAHVIPLTQSEHNYKLDSCAGKRIAQTHCKRGHQFDDANTYVRPNGMRMCRQCKKDARRDAYQTADFAERTAKQRAYRHGRGG